MQDVLSKREKEIVNAIIEHELFTSKQIANHFGITCNTINSHLDNIYKKLNIDSFPALIDYYYTHY